MWCKKKKKKVVVDEVETRLKELLPKIAEESGCTIDTMEVMPDHIHIFLNKKN